MASNHALQPVRDQGWLQGLPNLIRQENHRWWHTRQWIVQILIWLLIVNGLLTAILLSERDAARQAQNRAMRQAVAEAQADDQELQASSGTLQEDPVATEAMTVFLIFLGLAPAVGVAILGQGAVVQEKQTGTAAWVLSKPMSRSAFVLSKIAGNALGTLVTMILVQGVVGYLLMWFLGGFRPALLPFAGGLALVYLSLLFYLTLTIMLGTLFGSRGPVIGIPLAVLFGYQLIAGVFPWLMKIMPWVLTISTGPGTEAHAVLVALGQPLPSWLPTLATGGWCLVFTAVALWRFGREEF
jgi:ABC-2 type transport system permease protein